MHSFIKLQAYDGTGSLETFLMKFCHMANYLQWDDEDTFHHLSASSELVAVHVLWDISPRAMMADLSCLLQTMFCTQLQAECFKAELHARRRAQGESLQSLYQDICMLVTLAYISAEASLVMLEKRLLCCAK